MKIRQAVSGIPSTFDMVASDPLGYIHVDRISLSLDVSVITARHRSVINDMLLQDFCLAPLEGQVDAMHPWIRSWRLLPSVATLVGSWLLRSELAWEGRLLQLPVHVRRFIATRPVEDAFGVATPVRTRAATLMAAGRDDLMTQVQALGIRHVRGWHHCAPLPLMQRLRLMFAPVMDSEFLRPVPTLERSRHMLIMQAIHHAKNHTNCL